MQITLWDGQSIVNYYNDKWWPVIYREDTKTYFEKLGFRGNNLSFQNDALHVMYFFKETTFYEEDLEDLNSLMNQGSNIKNLKMYSNADQEIIFIFRKNAYIGKFYYDMDENKNSLSNLKPIDYPEDFDISIDRINMIDIRPFKFNILLKEPIELVSFNTSTLTLFRFKMPAILNTDEVKSCHLFVSFFFLF